VLLALATARADPAQDALGWFQANAAKGDPGAQVGLGVSHLRGDGVPKDAVKAVEWIRKAADQGDETATADLKELQVTQ